MSETILIGLFLTVLRTTADLLRSGLGAASGRQGCTISTPTEPLATRRDGRSSASDLGWSAKFPPGKGRYPLSDRFLATIGSARRMTIFSPVQGSAQGKSSADASASPFPLEQSQKGDQIEIGVPKEPLFL